MDREEAFALEFDNRFKIVAGGWEVPLDDVTVVYKDEYDRGCEFLLNRDDVIKFAKCLGVTGDDLID